jgi:hypothetical protein
MRPKTEHLFAQNRTFPATEKSQSADFQESKISGTALESTIQLTNTKNLKI